MQKTETKIREILFYKDYFTNFFAEQRPKVKDKILWTLKLIEVLKVIPSDYFEHITGTAGLFEIRVKQRSDIFRIFCFFDEGNLIVLANGFQKKTQKTPALEIQKALLIKQAYEQEKQLKTT